MKSNKWWILGGMGSKIFEVPLDFFSMKNSCNGVQEVTWIKSLKNILIWSHFKAINIDFFPKNFRISENFSKSSMFSNKIGYHKTPFLKMQSKGLGWVIIKLHTKRLPPPPFLWLIFTFSVPKTPKMRKNKLN